MSWLLRNLTVGFSAIIGFVLCAFTLQQIDPLRGVPDVKAQVQRVWANPDATAVFIGSSLTRRGVNPAVFDQCLSNYGIACKSFNCGIDGMTMPEVLFMVDQVLRQDLPNLKWVILESSQIRTRRDQHEVNKRDVYWRSTTLTLLLLEKSSIGFSVPPNQPPTPRKLFADHVFLWLQRFTNLGRITDFTGRTISAQSLPPLAATVGDRTFYSDERGFLGIDSEVPAEERDQLNAETAGISGLWAKAVEDPVGTKALRGLSRRLRRIGAHLILVQPPDTRRQPAPYPSLAQEGVAELNFMQPSLYPELYLPEHRYDSRHLNRKGANLFSRLLAEGLRSAWKKEWNGN